MDKPPLDPDDYRYVGAVMGALSGLLYFWPSTFRDAAARFVFSFICGVSLYFVPGWLMNWDAITTVDANHIRLGGAMVIALFSWPLAGVLIKYAARRAERDPD